MPFTQEKTKYPNADWRWAEFCLAEYEEELAELTEQSAVTIDEFSSLLQNVSQYQEEMSATLCAVNDEQMMCIIYQPSTAGMNLIKTRHCKKFRATVELQKLIDCFKSIYYFHCATYY